MTVASAVEIQTVLVFDSLAEKDDDFFTRSMIGRAQREAVWDVMINTFDSGSHILELNCGTGKDALFLAWMTVYRRLRCIGTNDQDGSAAHAGRRSGCSDRVQGSCT